LETAAVSLLIFSNTMSLPLSFNATAVVVQQLDVCFVLHKGPVDSVEAQQHGKPHFYD